MKKTERDESRKDEESGASKVDPDRHLAFVLLRYRTHQTQAEFGSKAHISSGQMSLYDQAKRTVPDPALERSARESKVPLFLVPPLLRSLRSLRLAAQGWWRAKRLPADLAFADLLALSGSAVDVVLSVGARDATAVLHAPRAWDRAEVPALWARLEHLSPAQQLALIEEDEAFQNWALCERLAAESVALAPERPADSLGYARLACRVAELWGGEPSFHLRLQGYAAIHLANSLRVLQEAREARGTFQEGKLQWEEGASGDRGILNEAIIFALESDLQYDERRFPEALSCIDQALVADRGDLRSKLLLTKAQILEALGEVEGSTAALEKAVPLIDADRDPRTALGVRFQFLVNLCREDRAAAAEPGLPLVRSLAERSGKERDRLCLEWLEGKIAAGVGRHAEAEALFRQVRHRFEADRLAYDYALVSLDLALLLLDRGGTAEVRALAEEMVWIFTAQGIAREALGALQLFCDAARREAATADLARRVARYLERASYDPELPFDRGDGAR